MTGHLNSLAEKLQTNYKKRQSKNIKTCADKVIDDSVFANFNFKGVLHPRSVFGLFLHFPQKLQHIGDK